jgi:hypothetical protein
MMKIPATPIINGIAGIIVTQINFVEITDSAYANLRFLQFLIKVSQDSS